MPRGRPKKVVEPAPTELESAVAEILQGYCNIPGCRARFHMEEARRIVNLVQAGKTKKINGDN